MDLKDTRFPPVKRNLPFDKTSKLILRIAHCLSASILIGAVYYGIKTSTEIHLIIAISGILMILRETIKGGLWVLQIRSIFIWVKIIALVWIILTGHVSLAPIIAIYILGTMSSHTTKKIRKRKFIPPYTYG